MEDYGDYGISGHVAPCPASSSARRSPVRRPPVLDMPSGRADETVHRVAIPTEPVPSQRPQRAARNAPNICATSAVSCVSLRAILRNAWRGMSRSKALGQLVAGAIARCTTAPLTEPATLPGPAMAAEATTPSSTGTGSAAPEPDRSPRAPPPIRQTRSLSLGPIRPNQNKPALVTATGGRA